MRQWPLEVVEEWRQTRGSEENDKEISVQTGIVKLGKIGGGAFGQVFKGFDLETSEFVAIKVIDLDETKDDILVIRREIVALSEGLNCPQLVAYKGTRVVGTQLWILMEFMKGGSLAERIKVKVLTEKETAIVVRQILLGLEHLHSENKIHRDIKAANILIREDGRIKLGDLGASAQLTLTKPSTDTMIGSPYWMAPEVMRQDKHDCSADIWSLGITCIELVKGRPPNSNMNALQVVMKVPMNPPPKLEDAEFSAEFKTFIAACLQKVPELRPSVKELLQHPFLTDVGDSEHLIG